MARKKFKKWKKKWKGKSIKSKVNSLTAKVARLKSNVELKYIEDSGSGVHVNTTTAVQCLNLCDQGITDENDRIGEEITVKKVMIRGVFNNNQGTPEDCIIRVIIARRIDVSGVDPSMNTMLTTSDYMGFKEQQHMHDYVIYYDTTFTMDTSQHALIPFKFSKRLNMKTRFHGTGGGIDDLENNGIFIFFYSSVAGTTNCPVVTYAWRTTFTDS